jgi:lipopolysaccharide biosynthesis glycosyltransferase
MTLHANAVSCAGLLYCFDKGYAAASLVSAHSALETASKPLVVHFSHDGPIDFVRPMVDRLAGHPNCANLFLRPLVYPDHVGEHVGKLLRVYCGRLLARPPEGGRVIYLDGDTIVQNDILPLAEHDLGDFPIGAVQDTMFLSWHYKAQGGNKRRRQRYQKTLAAWSSQMASFRAERYFNSGVLLIDYERVDALGLYAKMQDVDHVSHFRYPDQDFLNDLFCNKVAWLDPRWNAQWGNIETRRSPIPRRVQDEWRGSRNHPAILHYIGKPKPWMALNAKEFLCLLGIKQLPDVGNVLAMRRAYAQARSNATKFYGLDPFHLE